MSRVSADSGIIVRTKPGTAGAIATAGDIVTTAFDPGNGFVFLIRCADRSFQSVPASEARAVEPGSEFACKNCDGYGYVFRAERHPDDGPDQCDVCEGWGHGKIHSP